MGVGGCNTYDLKGKKFGASKYQNLLLKLLYFIITKCGKILSSFTDITAGIYGIYKLPDKHASTPHFTRALLWITVVTVT